MASLSRERRVDHDDDHQTTRHQDSTAWREGGCLRRKLNGNEQSPTCQGFANTYKQVSPLNPIVHRIFFINLLGPTLNNNHAHTLHDARDTKSNGATKTNPNVELRNYHSRHVKTCNPRMLKISNMEYISACLQALYLSLLHKRICLPVSSRCCTHAARVDKIHRIGDCTSVVLGRELRFGATLLKKKIEAVSVKRRAAATLERWRFKIAMVERKIETASETRRVNAASVKRRTTAVQLRKLRATVPIRARELRLPEEAHAVEGATYQPTQLEQEPSKTVVDMSKTGKELSKPRKEVPKTEAELLKTKEERGDRRHHQGGETEVITRARKPKPRKEATPTAEEPTTPIVKGGAALDHIA
ncbi:hypothetical protein KC19_VG329000 [Ceratodon purpureus]|uniref:Uncharacterized protein n=1 Tax=Ceratodon purpureus TaxID=3225 RepID=A0A8T0HX39_CERPU|nr:hypothetical protein KC19_VG329000 [Ceratodon purpureus]